MKKRSYNKKKLINFTEKMETDMRFFCRNKGIESESELIRQAVSKHIYSDYKDETLKLQGLKQLQETITELKDMVNITFKYIRLMHISTLAYHPEIDAQLADAAYKSATVRHDKFFNSFQDSLKNDPPFFERLLHKYYSEENNEQGG
ncbi:MAG: hypothetical protein LBQ89_02740 [Treponema sp.]|jgi:hypothetical protein|nr:hypothetical protein [Treponema sp.]